MMSIKKSFAECSECQLLQAPSCILETNCEKDLSKVECIYIAENPGKTEIKEGKPLVGKTGKIFRSPFNKLKLNKFPYLITNVVLCVTLTPDGKTGNPTEDIIERCKVNCFNIIEQCNPKLIVLMGGSAMKAFGLKGPVTELAGKFYKWSEYNVFATVHPSYVDKNRPAREPEFEEHFKKVKEFLEGSDIDSIKSNKSISVGKIENQGIYRYKIPEKFYTPEYRLIDVQYISSTDEILYIFRDSNNNKVYHSESSKFIYYVPIDKEFETRKIVSFDKLNAISIPYKDRILINTNNAYEADIHISAKHAMDYYYFSQGESKKIKDNIYFFDIEVDSGDFKGFPDIWKAEYPINLITSSYNGEYICYVIDNKTRPIDKREDVILKIFKNEKDLLKEFIKDFKNYDSDYMSGWNSIMFDILYISNRFRNLKIPIESLSKFKDFYINAESNICHLGGHVVLDQEALYKTFERGRKENYKLDTIAKLELKRQKVELPYHISEIYAKDINLMIDYNINDTRLLVELEDKIKHVNLIDEIRLACNTSFHDGKSSFGQIDSLVVSYLRKNNFASKTGTHKEKIAYKGAFVLQPIPGIYDCIADLDFTSLYPSNILTYNIGIDTFVMRFKDSTLGYDYVYNKKNLPSKVIIIMDPTYLNLEVEMGIDEVIQKATNENLIITINGCFFKNHSDQVSSYSQILEFLMKSRKIYKKEMLEAKEKGDKENTNYFDTRQNTYKVIANSLYGVVAKEIFRFFDNFCAEAITLSGQEALKTSIIESNSFIEHLNKSTDLIRPIPLTKEEMYGSDIHRKFDYIITGDTDSIFICFQKFSSDIKSDKLKQLDLCIKTQQYLNKNIISDMVKLHNVDLKNNRLELKNELLISRGLFVAKKRYSIRAINQEGKDIDEIVNMGLETKRSDYPSMSKDFLNELLQLILKSDKISITALGSFLANKEKEFKKAILEGDKRIARPVSYTKTIDKHKTVGQSIKAITAWNEIMYNSFVVGDKGHMFRVLGIDYSKAPTEVISNYEKYLKRGYKLEAVAIPDDVSKLPDFFIIDLKGNLEFSFTDRHDLLLKPIVDLKNKQKNSDVVSF